MAISKERQRKVESLLDLEDQMLSKSQQIGYLKSRLSLDLFDFKVNLVAEYPDMVQENIKLHSESETLNKRHLEMQKAERDLNSELREVRELL